MIEDAWVKELFRSIDAKDTRRLLTFLSDDASFRFGNAPPTRGIVAISELLDGFFASIQALRHEIINTWAVADHVLCQGKVTYTRHDGSTLSVPFFNVFVMRGERVTEYLIYVDASQLYVSQP